MAKAFKEYTIEDLYRLNFSFLIQSIKDKELSDSSLDEEAFIRVQRIALMNIFQSCDSLGIDSSLQVIEPFLDGRRVITDLVKIQAIASGLTKEAKTKDQRVISIELNDGLSVKYADFLKNSPITANKHEIEIKSLRDDIASKDRSISEWNNNVILYSQKIYNNKMRISELMNFIAIEKAKGIERLNPITELVHYLQANNFKIIGFNRDGSNTIQVARICRLKAKNPESRNQYFDMPITVFLFFKVNQYGIEVYGNRAANRGFYGNLVSVYYHPHINDSDAGGFCLGNTATLLGKISRDGVFNNIGDFVKIYADLLDGYNPESPYRILQEVYCNNVNLMLNVRRFVNMPEPSELAKLDINDELFENCGHLIATHLKANVNGSFDVESIKELFIETVEAFKESITKELITFIYNSGVSISSMPSNYFGELGDMGSHHDVVLKFLTLFGGMEYEETNNEED